MRMTIDDDVMLTSEFMRDQLANTDAIVRDVAAAPSTKRAAPPSDPFSGPPSLSFLPPAVSKMACFQPDASVPRSRW